MTHRKLSRLAPVAVFVLGFAFVTLLRDSVDLLGEYAKSAAICLRPSSAYTPHEIVDRLPWRRAADAVTSDAAWLVLIALAAAAWLGRSGRRAIGFGIGMALPVLYVVVASVAGERGENMRFRFFVEPVVYVFVVTEAGLLAHRLRARFPTASPAG